MVTPHCHPHMSTNSQSSWPWEQQCRDSSPCRKSAVGRGDCSVPTQHAVGVSPCNMDTTRPHSDGRYNSTMTVAQGLCLRAGRPSPLHCLPAALSEGHLLLEAFPDHPRLGTLGRRAYVAFSTTVSRAWPGAGQP